MQIIQSTIAVFKQTIYTTIRHYIQANNTKQTKTVNNDKTPTILYAPKENTNPFLLFSFFSICNIYTIYIYCIYTIYTIYVP